MQYLEDTIASCPVGDYVWDYSNTQSEKLLLTTKTLVITEAHFPV